MCLFETEPPRYHPVIGIAALGSPIVQIKERDDWIGWQSKPLLTRSLKAHTGYGSLGSSPYGSGNWEIYLDDLLEDGLYWPSLWSAPTQDAIDRLRKEAEARRNDHRRFVMRAEFKRNVDAGDSEAWRQRAESDLFRSKRCLALADLLRSRAALASFVQPVPSRAGLADGLADPEGRRAVADIVRRAKAEAIGTEMADLTVCGAIAPYNALLGGKLVSMLSVSPSITRAYRDRYTDYAEHYCLLDGWSSGASSNELGLRGDDVPIRIGIESVQPGANSRGSVGWRGTIGVP